jgi:hypothetical protein
MLLLLFRGKKRVYTPKIILFAKNAYFHGVGVNILTNISAKVNTFSTQMNNSIFNIRSKNAIFTEESED